MSAQLFKNNDLDELHPLFKEKTIKLIKLFDENNLPFKLFEGFRSPERQNRLYQQGRTIPGNIITKAKPWDSFHQYGLAGDFVLYINGKWSWEDKTIETKKYWNELHRLARILDLEPLSWELPHLQLKNLKLSELKNGIYPKYKDINEYNKWVNKIKNLLNNTNFVNTPITILKLNDRGIEVENLQRLLNKKLNINLSTDGHFGNKTKEAVQLFQNRNNLTVDGIVGPKTFELLKKDKK